MRDLFDTEDHERGARDEANRKVEGKSIKQNHEKDRAAAYFLRRDKIGYLAV